ncbi:MAG TPA: phosphoglycolate phosphatase [Lachnoclostridium sp.]|uniref:HAD superfamily hydrolase (TIGR01549 family) n=1 Tax=[Clostridium] celerecrescens 18A TaxID=1286362 RepID=A0A2M8Z093_9FIRM|nr:HAD family hydrolase [Lacrimispora celerecrescens]PJJ26864.1 HAD superfamily hydrolase (TIGR01549 family) [[Clostridium] celerecrescens 18A]HBE84983.1 phosphoglycolate phosphatase [Lachnoclostridium sp.]
MRYKHIVFDIDGTLIDTEYAVLHSLQDTLITAAGINKEINELTFALGIPGKNALKILNIPERSFSLILGNWEKCMSNYSNTICVFQGISELLDTLVQYGYELGIVTSKTREEFKQDFEPFDISKYFTTIICADDTTEHKPDPDPLFKYMEVSNANNNELIYIGDSIYDWECAKSARVDFALAGWGSLSREIQADYYLEKPDDLLSIMRD